MDGEASISRTATVTQIVIVLVFAGLAVKLFFIQVVAGPESARAADRQQRMKMPDVPKRGDIRASDGTLLATSERVPSLYADPERIANPSGVAAMLSAAIGLDPTRIERKLMRRRPNGTPYRFVWLARFLSESDAVAVHSLSVPGLHFRYEYKRRYPQGKMLAQVLGFVTQDEKDRDDRGLEGLELAFNNFLRTTPGQRTSAVDARRRPIPSLGEEGMPGIDGHNVILTIDPEIQAITEAALDEAFVKWKAEGAIAIVMRPYTGEILAIASRPGYDPNRFSASTPHQRRNRAITDAYDPGSTFKPFTVAAALNLGLVRPDTMISVTGSVGGRTIRDHVRSAMLSVRDVVVKSSNVGAARIGMMLTHQQLRDFVVSLGFGRPTDLGLRGEARGRITPMERWNNYSQASVAFGQEMTVTPLQLASAYCSLGNYGILFRPYLIARIEDTDGNLLQQNEPQELRRVLSYEAVQQIRPILQAVVEEGTGKKAATEHFTVGGKTGTAQKALPNGRGYSETDYVGYFVGIAPVPRPELCVLVAVDTPHGSHYGGTVAAPAVSEIIEKSLIHLQVKPDK